MDEKQNPNPNTDPNRTSTDATTGTGEAEFGTATETTDSTETAASTSETPTESPATPGADHAAAATVDEEPSNITALIIGAIVVALLLVGVAWFVMSDEGMSVEDPAMDGVGALDGFDEGDPDEVVATINGNELTRADFNRIRQQVMQTAQQQGMDLNDPNTVQQVNDQAMETLINTELIRQAAVAAGITVSDEEVDARFAEVVDSVGGPEALAESLEQLGLTEASLRSDVEQELVVQGYLEESVDTEFTASEEEVQAFYDQQGGAEQLPPLDEVREQIEQQLVMLQEQEVIEGLLQELRAEADIETMI